MYDERENCQLTEHLYCKIPSDDFFTRVVFLSKCRLERNRLTVVIRINLDYDHRLISAVRSIVYDASCTISDPIHIKIQVA